MAEQGFPSFVDKWGQVGIEFKAGQEDDYKLADYVCQAKYPFDDKHFKPFDQQQLRTIYDWRVGTTIPCLQTYGATVPVAPSFELFQDSYESTGYVLWSPVSDPGLLFPEDTDLDHVHMSCPDTPPDDVLVP